MTEKIEPLTECAACGLTHRPGYDNTLCPITLNSPAPMTDAEIQQLREIEDAVVQPTIFVRRLLATLDLERTARQKAEERVRELEDVISGCVLCSSPDTRWDEAMARYRAALTTDPPKEG
jgi:hypothetical protein